ncbi:MAG: ParA family protein [Burkholderiaceae bacterium]|jgi:chromosome partitioning protein|nr:ParA family protein [Burkholderiaceae bacterium]MEB2320154.1 ParA family protein [Pseudomonadota bacterium]
MPVVAVLNPKGGVGKTTLATNLAGYFAANRARTMLGDIDRQESAKYWLRLRPKGVAPIETWEVNGVMARPPQGVTHVVLDTPAQISDSKVADIVRVADKVLVPVAPSLFDVVATQDFLQSLRRAYPSMAEFRKHVRVVGMRVDPRTKAADELARCLAEMDIDVAGYLRNTHNYVHLAAHGLTVFDVPSKRIAADRATWTPLLGWVTSH